MPGTLPDGVWPERYRSQLLVVALSGQVMGYGGSIGIGRDSGFADPSPPVWPVCGRVSRGVGRLSSVDGPRHFRRFRRACLLNLGSKRTGGNLAKFECR